MAFVGDGDDSSVKKTWLCVAFAARESTLLFVSPWLLEQFCAADADRLRRFNFFTNTSEKKKFRCLAQQGRVLTSNAS